MEKVENIKEPEKENIIDGLDILYSVAVKSEIREASFIIEEHYKLLTKKD